MKVPFIFSTDFSQLLRPDLLGWCLHLVCMGGSHAYWENLDARMKLYANENGLEYVRDDDSMKNPFDAPPVIVNFFYHEEIKKSAKREKALSYPIFLLKYSPLTLKRICHVERSETSFQSQILRFAQNNIRGA